MNDLRGFTRRFLFEGTLILSTGLHIGGGRGCLSPTDSPVVRTPEGWPFIPGSSMKGAFRSTVEKLASSVPGVWSCALADGACAGAPGHGQDDLRARNRDECWTEDELLRHLDKRLCHTCKLFGSPFMASRLQFHDLLPAQPQDAMVQVRDGVAIDRDSERAVDRLKFDYEVVSSEQSFKFRLQLDEPGPLDVGLTCVGLSEYSSGFGHIGGKRSRGLGAVRLEELQVYTLDLTGADAETRARKLKKYLLGQTPATKMEQITDAPAFLDGEISNLLTIGLAG